LGDVTICPIAFMQRPLSFVARIRKLLSFFA
jgi:hypothetical protein